MAKTKYTFDIKFHDVFPKLLAQLGTKNQAEVAEFLDMTPGAITNFKKRNSFSADSLIKFALKKNISVDFLLGRKKSQEVGNGKESRLYALDDLAEERREERREEDKYYTFFPLFKKEGEPSFERMPFMKVFALKEWLSAQVKEVADNAFMLLMEGDSMVKTIFPGNILFCVGQSGAISDRHIDDAIYVLRIENGSPIVRRMQELPKRMIKIIADNPVYESFLVSRDSDCQILGRVVWVVKKL